MKYMAQMRIKSTLGVWGHWQSVGDPMTSEEADEWLSFDRIIERYEGEKGPREKKIEFRLITVPDNWPSVFGPRMKRG